MFRRLFLPLCLQRNQIKAVVSVGRVLGFTGSAVIPVTLNNTSLSSLPSTPRDYLKHACLMNINAASSLITTNLFLLEKLHHQYKDLMTSLTGMLDDCVLLDGWDEERWESVIALRQEVNALKAELDFLDGHVEIVDKIVNGSIEAAFNVGAEYLCTTLCQHSHLAQEKLNALRKEAIEIENMYLLAQTNVASYKNKHDDEKKLNKQ